MVGLKRQVLFFNMLQNALASIFNQVEHMFKTLVAVVIRIRHDRAAHVAAELRQAVQLVALPRWAQGLCSGHVFMIHHQHQVVAFEIFTRELTCAQITQVVAA